MTSFPPIGIHEIGFYFPKSYVDIHELAVARSIVPEKLTRGLGLKEMAVCQKDETIDYLIYRALDDLKDQCLSNDGVNPQEWMRGIDRVYLGTESAIDGAKPTATYGLDRFAKAHNLDISHIDALDMTFACIGAMDALQTCMEYVRLNPDRKCVVIAADVAKYDLNSGGEYTQGAGAIAMLVTVNPKLVSYSPNVGVDMKPDFDFYKPQIRIEKSDILNQISELLDLDAQKAERLKNWLYKSEETTDTNGYEGKITGLNTIPSDYIAVSRKEPIYNGAYSNTCYKDRVNGALNRFLEKHESDISEFQGWIFHLPFCFQGRKTAVEFWVNHILKRNQTQLQAIVETSGEAPQYGTPEYSQWLKNVSKSDEYRQFVSQSIQPGEILSARLGNMYTASVFFSLMSYVAYAHDQSTQVLQLAYGSGSKSKVFSSEITANAQRREHLRNRFEQRLNSREKISVASYEEIHKNY